MHKPANSFNEQQQIHAWSYGQIVAVPEYCVQHLFERQVRLNPEAVALTFGKEQLTYKDLNQRANQFAHLLMERGIGPEVIVGVCLERSLELVIVILAILKAGGAFLPLDPNWPSQRLKAVLSCGASFAIADAKTGSLIGNAAVIISINDAFSREFSIAAQANPLVAISSNTAAYILYTSGSTGLPKGVLIEHGALSLRCFDLARRFRIKSKDRVLAHTSVGFDISIVELLIPLTVGAQIILLAESDRRDPKTLIRLLISHHINVFQATPSHWQALIALGYKPEKSLTAIAGGEVLTSSLATAITATCRRLINGYGPTESAIYATCSEIDNPQKIDIGRPLSNTEVHVLNQDLSHSSIGVIGELYIGGVGVARGYINDPELTAQRFIANPFSSEPNARLYKSGDLVSWNPDGTLAFHGRIDDQVKLRGCRVEPGEIEAVLSSHPLIDRAVVILREDVPENPQLVAYWIGSFADSCTSLSFSDLHTFLSATLPEYMLPSAFVCLESFPLTFNGKLDRNALPRLNHDVADSDDEPHDELLMPRKLLEMELLGIWREAFGNNKITTKDNFFELGGHSLIAASIASRIEAITEREISFSTFFKFQSIAELAAYLRRDTDAKPASQTLVPLQKLGAVAPIFVIHGWGGMVDWHLDLARALAPDQPVYGLLAAGKEDGYIDDHSSVEEMASYYATQIRSFQPNGPYHLLGYSAGGWYAYAVAAALLNAGGSIGFVGILDTHATAHIHRRLRLPMAIESAFRAPSHLLHLLQSSSNPWQEFITDVSQSLRYYLHMLKGARRKPIWSEARLSFEVKEFYYGDYYAWLHSAYRPPRLPIKVQLFTTPQNSNRLERLWRFYAMGGVTTHTMFEHHLDFSRPSHMPELAGYLRQVLENFHDYEELEEFEI